MLRAAVLVAAVGSSLVAIPFLFGAFSFAIVCFGDISRYDLGFELVLRAIGYTLLAVGPSGVGVYLLAGYWREWSRWMAPDRPKVFWLVSAAFNGVGFAVFVFIALSGVVWTAGLFLGLAWTIFMVALGAVQAGRVARDV